MRKYVSSADRGACSLLGRTQAGPAWVPAGNRGGDGLRWAVTPQPLTGTPVTPSEAQRASGVRWSPPPGFLLGLRVSVSGSLFLGVSKSTLHFFKMSCPFCAAETKGREGEREPEAGQLTCSIKVTVIRPLRSWLPQRQGATEPSSTLDGFFSPVLLVVRNGSPWTLCDLGDGLHGMGTPEPSSRDSGTDGERPGVNQPGGMAHSSLDQTPHTHTPTADRK